MMIMIGLPSLARGLVFPCSLDADAASMDDLFAAAEANAAAANADADGWVDVEEPSTAGMASSFPSSLNVDAAASIDDVFAAATTAAQAAAAAAADVKDGWVDVVDGVEGVAVVVESKKDPYDGRGLSLTIVHVF